MEQTFEARFLSARRAVIAARFQNLNEMQREGVLTTQGPLLLLAGAGSGKTTVLINRIANLIAFGEGSDSNEIPEYITEEDVTYLEDYLKTRDPAMQQQAERLCALRPAAPGVAWRPQRRERAAAQEIVRRAIAKANAQVPSSNMHRFDGQPSVSAQLRERGA